MNQERLLKVILSPHVSEKATIGMDKVNQYVFKVACCSTKPEVKDAIEQLFNTKVKSVRIVNTKPKRRTFKGIEGFRKGWKKAYVTLQANQKLNIFEAP
jgi:large subunit ribosomal protein L23